jgi:dihydroorotase
MKILVQQALIYDSDSPHHGSKQDILIEDGVIREIGVSISVRADRTIREEGLAVSPGWVDVFSHFCDPGLEFKETLETGSLAAAAGGYTEVFLVPNTKPVVDNKTQVEYIRRQSGRFCVELWPIGALTKNGEGKDLAEMYDMYGSGAIAFGHLTVLSFRCRMTGRLVPVV